MREETPLIGGIVKKAYIVAHKEDINELKMVLEREGFDVQVVRGPYSDDQQSYTAQIKCLINHGNVWRRMIESGEIALVVEADFVPVSSLSHMPLPCPEPSLLKNGVFSYIYTCGPIIYGCDDVGHVFGHSASTVAYIADGRAAQHLLSFLDQTLDSLEPGKYAPWDTGMGVYLRKKCGILNFFPIRNYGEHGGEANLEHLKRGYKRNWHRADMLASNLAFYPGYSGSDYFKFLRKRMSAWFWGLARLFLLRLYDPRFINENENCTSRWKLFRIALARSLFGTKIGKPVL